MEYWPQVKIGDVCIVERGGSPRPIDKYITDSEDGINWIKIGDTDDSMYITSTAQKIIPEGAKKSRYVQPGDFLLSNSMSFGRPYILKIDGCIHDGWLVLRDKNGLFDKRFLYYYLSAPVTYQKFKSLAVGGVVNNLNSEMVRNVEVPLPALNEQAQIATVLDKLSDLISLRKQQLAKLDELVKARFVEMFGDEKQFTSMPLSESVEEMFIGPFGSSLKNDCFVSKEDAFCMVYEQKHAIRKTMDVATRYVGQTKYNELKRFTVVGGDIIVSCRGTIGEIYVLPDNAPLGIMHPSIMKIRLKESVYNKNYFVFALEQSMKKHNDEANGSGVKMAVTATTLGKERFAIPPMPSQQQFANFVIRTNRQKLTIQQSLDKLEVLRKSLMQEYFG
ncbi:restriction endonuclease subunit S [Oscillospiraceae bacterium 50-58]